MRCGTLTAQPSHHPWKEAKKQETKTGAPAQNGGPQIEAQEMGARAPEIRFSPLAPSGRP